MLHATAISRVVLAEVLPRAVSGQVHSVYQRVCNLLVGDELVGLVAPELGCGPYAVQVAPPAGGFATSPAWQPGSPITVVGERLMTIGGRGVSWEGALVWEPEPPLPWASPGPGLGAGLGAGLDARLGGDGDCIGVDRLGLADDSLAASCGRLRAAFCGDAADHLGVAICSRAVAGGLWEAVLAALDGRPYQGPLSLAVPRLAALWEALSDRRFDHRVLGEATRSLVGLGPGLTPSGDDLLAGLVATLVRASRWGLGSMGLRHRADQLGRLLREESPGRTTTVSLQLLKGASRGWLAERPSDLLTALLTGAPDVLTRLPGVLTLGHTSGSDMVAGIYMGLRLIAEAGAVGEGGARGTARDDQAERLP